MNGVSTAIVILSLLLIFALCMGIVYVTQSEEERQGPIEPTAFPVMQAGGEPISEWETISTYEIESLSLSDEVIQIGEHLYATGVVKNTGSEKGIAKIELKVNDKTLSSQKVALMPGESKSVKFVILVPGEGRYTARMGNLTKDFKVKKARE